MGVVVKGKEGNQYIIIIMWKERRRRVQTKKKSANKKSSFLDYSPSPLPRHQTGLIMDYLTEWRREITTKVPTSYQFVLVYPCFLYSYWDQRSAICYIIRKYRCIIAAELRIHIVKEQNYHLWESLILFNPLSILRQLIKWTTTTATVRWTDANGPCRNYKRLSRIYLIVLCGPPPL